MSWWEALVMGAVQGLTEFFPVSSSGHLVMTERLLRLELPGIGFEVALHVATLISVLYVYRARVASLALGLVGRGDDDAWNYFLKLVVATIPAAVVGLTLEDWFAARFDDPAFTGTMLLVTGSVVWSTRWARGERRFGPAEALPIGVAALFSVLAGTLVPFVAVLAIEAALMAAGRLTAGAGVRPVPDWIGAALIGLAQATAILPGVSRSGSTVVTALWRRVDPVAAAEFSFLMSVPAIAGAAVLSLPDLADGGGSVPLAALVVGFVAAAAAGILAIRFFVALLRHQNFYNFAWYCWMAGGLFLLYVRSVP